MLFKRRTLHWTFMFARALNNHEPERVGRVLQDIAKLTEQGVLKTTVSKTFDNFFEDIQAAHTLSESGKVMGKIVLAVPQTGRGVRAGACARDKSSLASLELELNPHPVIATSWI